MNKHLIVALHMTRLSVPDKINRSRFIVETMAGAGSLFPNPVPNLGTVTIAINNLENAWNDAADGGKQKTAFMHAKEDDLMKMMYDLAHYVQRVANGDREIVIAAGMEVKKDVVRHSPDFDVVPTDDGGAVKLKVKPRDKTFYRWEYRKDSQDENNWTVGTTTDVCTTSLGGLDQGEVYWFRVVFITIFGVNTPYPPKKILVE